MRVLVAGAGICGLATTLGLLRAGHEVRVLEEAEAPRLGGGAINLWPHGTYALRALGVETAKLGQRFSRLALRTATGHRVLELDLDTMTTPMGSETRATPRGTLITALASLLPAEAVGYGDGVVDAGTDRDGAWARTASGRAHRADLLVGADGVRSRVRQAVLGGPPAVATGVATWQGLTPAPFDTGATTTLTLGRQGDCGYMGAGDGLTQWFFDLPSTIDVPPSARLDVLRRRYGGWASPIPELLDALSPADIEIFPHTRHRVPVRWGAGRCVLLGDAAHAMPPVMAHGANQGLEDVSVLLECLESVALDEVVDVYSARRRRAAKVASAIASRSLAISGPRTLAQSGPLLRPLALAPRRVVTAGFAGMLKAVSARR